LRGEAETQRGDRRACNGSTNPPVTVRVLNVHTHSFSPCPSYELCALVFRGSDVRPSSTSVRIIARASIGKSAQIGKQAHSRWPAVIMRQAIGFVQRQVSREPARIDADRPFSTVRATRDVKLVRVCTR